VHGGGWVDGGRGEVPAWAAWLNELGFTVYDIDYRLPPLDDWSDEVVDVASALVWVWTHASEHGTDAGRITVMGHSSGANVALLAAFRGTDRLVDPPAVRVPVRAVVNIYGPADLSTLVERSSSRRYLDDCLRRYLGGDVAAVRERYDAASPVSALDLSPAGSSPPPTFTVLGRRDRIVPVDQAETLDIALGAAGTSHDLWLLPGTDHSFDLRWDGFATQITRSALGRFLAAYG
jgi:acetyl esterase/lipase